MRPYNYLAFCTVIITCSCGTTRNPATSDPSLPGTLHLDITDSAWPHHDLYRAIDLIPATGLIKESPESHRVASSGTTSFSTGQLADCEQEPSAEYRDGTYLAKCNSTHTGYGIRDSIEIVAQPGSTDTVVWSRKLDPGWSIRGFWWNASFPLLAIVVDSSVPQENPIAWLLGLFGHPPPDETLHLIIVSTTTKTEKDFVVLKHVVYGYPRLIRWDNSAK